MAAAHPDLRRPALHRDAGRGVLGGVCAGLARRLGTGVVAVRIAAVVLVLAGGLGVPLYLLAWAAMPADPGATRRTRSRRGAVEVAVGVGLLAVSVLLVFRGLGIWFSDAVAWPLVLVAGGVALLWRGGRGPGTTSEVAATVAPPAPAVAPTPARPAAAAAPTASAAPARPAVTTPELVAVSRQGLGAALVIAAGVVFLGSTGALSAARDVILAALVVATVLGLIFAPWIVRLVRSLTAERAERIRSQERAELAAHLHDSVLQTLALMQKRADDPRSVAALARAQERELRAWLAGRSPAEGERSLAAALEAAAADVEARHHVAVDVVAVGDAELDTAGEALVAAAREAMVNAAKFGGGGPVAVYAEARAGVLEVFVRDRGPGFDPDAVPADRRGLRESVIGRMARHGGRATVHAAPGAGTEVALSLARGSGEGGENAAGRPSRDGPRPGA